MDFNRETTAVGNRHMRHYHKSSDYSEQPKKSYLNQATQKILAISTTFTDNHNMYKIANRMINMFPLINVEYCC